MDPTIVQIMSSKALTVRAVHSKVLHVHLLLPFPFLFPFLEDRLGGAGSGAGFGSGLGAAVGPGCVDYPRNPLSTATCLQHNGPSPDSCSQPLSKQHLQHRYEYGNVLGSSLHSAVQDGKEGVKEKGIFEPHIIRNTTTRSDIRRDKQRPPG